MRLLDRYLLRELIVPFIYCLAGFLIFWVSCDLLARMSEYQKLLLRPKDLVELYFVMAPGILVLTLPVAFLLSLLYALTNHARHNELTAMRAAGVSLARLALPYLAVGFVLSLVVFALGEFWVPQGNDEADEILARHQTDQKTTTRQRQWEPKVGYYNTIERRWWLVENYHLFSGEMIRPNVIWLTTNHTRIDIFAEHAAWTNGVWVFTNVHRFTYPDPPRPGEEPVQEAIAELSLPEFRESPDQIRSSIKINRLRSFKLARRTQLSIREILEFYRLNPVGIPATLKSVLDTKLHGQVASPWTCLVVVAIALPFGARPGRRNVAVGVASSIFICFAYFILLRLCLALGGGAHLPAWLAAWAPNVAFGLVGFILSWRLR